MIVKFSLSPLPGKMDFTTDHYVATYISIKLVKVVSLTINDKTYKPSTLKNNSAGILIAKVNNVVYILLLMLIYIYVSIAFLGLALCSIPKFSDIAISILWKPHYIKHIQQLERVQ